MTTSLAAQLQKLAVPQTSLLQQKNKRPSLLFDPKEAASIDRETFYDIGVSGLRELQDLNLDFAVFNNNLFSSVSKDIERSVEDKKFNSRLNKNIKHFLMVLSPYFLLKPAHKTLEWLIYRFSIHEYNQEDFLKLIFPYHETNIFVRTLQLFNFYNANNIWNWLRPVQKSGVHLNKLTLYNHAASDVGFLSFLGEMVLDAVHENKGKSNALTTLFTFYCTTIIGVLEKLEEITEPQLTAILPALLKGLSSDFSDYIASSYMITAQLLKKTKLSHSFLNKIVEKITHESQNKLRMEATLLLIVLYQSQDNYNSINLKSLQNLSKSLDWFPVNLGKLSSSGSYVAPILVPILEEAMKQINDDCVRRLVEKLFENVRVNDSLTEVLITVVLDNCPMENEKSDNTTTDLPQWYGDLLKKLETKHPKVFDKIITKTMSNSNSVPHKKALKSIMNFMMSGSSYKNAQTIFEKLYHPNADFRLSAIEFLVEKYEKLSEKDKDILRNAIQERLLDSDLRIVAAILKLSNQNLLDLLGEDNFIKAFIKLLTNSYKNYSTHKIIIKKLINHVCFGEISKNDNLLLVILPFLFPITPFELTIAKQIMLSDFSKNYQFLNKSKKVLLRENPVEFCEAIFKTFSNSIYMNNNLEEMYRKIPEKLEIHKYLFAVFNSISLKHDSTPEPALKLLKNISQFLSSSKYVSLKNKESEITVFIKTIRGNNLPLQGLLKCIETVINRVILNINDSWINLLDPDDSINFFIKILTIFLKGCALHNLKSVKCYIALLKTFLNNSFSDFRSKINFLSNFIVSDQLTDLKLDKKIQLRIVTIMYSLLDQTENSLNWTVDLNSSILVPNTIIGLISPLEEIRSCSIKILDKIANCICINTNKTFTVLLQEILKSKEEILLDADQLPLILYTIFIDEKAKNSIETLYKLATDQTIPFHINSLLLRVLAFINSIKIYTSSSKLALELLKSQNNENKLLDIHKSFVIYNNILRLNESIAKVIKLNSSIWNFIELCLKQDKIYLDLQKSKNFCPSVLILDQLTREIYENFSLDVQKILIKSIIEVATFSENPDVVSSANKTVRRIEMDANLVLDYLISMQNAKSNKNQPVRKFRRVTEVPTVDILDMHDWKLGITTLEIIQDKKKMTNSKILLPVLFKILKKCLDFDEQAAVEYPKQIILSSILHICNKMSVNNEIIPQSVFNMELVVQCIRASSNPQTHHHALLLLAHTANQIPEQVLHNIMAIFTFMGSSVLRHDDAYSFQIISKIIETIVPILIQIDEEKDKNVSQVLRVFVDVMLDVPEHRRKLLYKKLLVTLGVHEYLWLFLVLTFESHVVHGNDVVVKDSNKRLISNSEMIPKRLDIAMNIASEFSPEIILQTSIKLLEHIKELPTEKDENLMPFAIKQCTAKQFRHYKYTIATFLSSLLSSNNLTNSIAVLSKNESLLLEPMYKAAVINILTYIQSVSKTANKMTNSQHAQYWKVMLHHCYDIMDSINALLSTDMFILVIRGLIVHNISTVRRRAIEILNNKLQNQPEFFYSNSEDNEITNSEDLLAIIPSLMNIIKSADDSSENEQEFELIQQTALLSLKLLIKLLANKNPEKFISILDFITNLIKSKNIQGNVLASVMLCLAELCNKLRAHAIPALSRYMPAVIKVLKKQRSQDTAGLLLLCIITVIQKIVESLSLFLSPYLKKIIIEISIFSAKWCNDPSLLEDQKAAPFIKKLYALRIKIGKSIPSRILLPIITETYKTLLSERKYSAIGPLMNILSENLSLLKGNDLNSHLTDLTSFFLNALQFRTDFNLETTSSDIDTVEDEIIKTLTTLILKLSETTFRPFYYKLFDWAVRSETKTERIITFYRLSHVIASNLKGLFVLFAGHFVKNAASILENTNLVKNEDGSYFEDEYKNILLIESIFKTLLVVFKHDSKHFIDKDRFETLMQPMVDQLENELGGEQLLMQRANDLIIPCLAQFAIATSDDSLWKQLNYQILLKTRHNQPTVRLIGLNCLCEVARQMNDDFLPLLPETIPFLAELLEDEEEIVENTCQKVVQDLETILGEPLQKYF